VAEAEAIAGSPAAEIGKEPGRWRDYLVAAGFLAPAFVFLGVWIVYPALRTAGRSFYDADGSLRWRATVSGTIEIRLWILQWGADVEVIAPAGLRDDVADTHRRALALYG